MIVIAALVVGACLGWRRAKTLGGDWRDRSQYAAGFALALAMIGLFATILIERVT